MRLIDDLLYDRLYYSSMASRLCDVIMRLSLSDRMDDKTPCESEDTCPNVIGSECDIKYWPKGLHIEENIWGS